MTNKPNRAIPTRLAHTGAVILPLFCRELRARRGLHGVLQDLRELTGSSWSLLGGGGMEEAEGEEEDAAAVVVEDDELDGDGVQLRRWGEQAKGAHGQQQQQQQQQQRVGGHGALQQLHPHPRGRIPSGTYT
jgi:hypothetical protein